MKKPSLYTSPLRAVCATILVGLAALPSIAQSNPALTTPPATPAQPLPADPVLPAPSENNQIPNVVQVPNRETERFISRISMLHSEEARLSTIASQRASNMQVRTFAGLIQTAVQDREQELDKLALARNVTIPTGRDANDLADENEKWQKKDGKDFDEDYVNQIIKIQKNSIESLEDYSKDNDSDPELVAFAQKHLPVLKENLRQAQSLDKQVD